MAVETMSHEVAVHTAADLQARRQDLERIVNAINLAFTKMSNAGFEGPRFPISTDLLTMLGPHGLCAVVCSASGAVLASASSIPWRPDHGEVIENALKRDFPDEHGLVDKGLSYQVKAVVTAATPDARSKGLAGLCIQALVSRLSTQHPGESELLLWILLAEDQNGNYWRRRGYEQVGPVEIKPKGMWGSANDFKFATLVKKVTF